MAALQELRMRLTSTLHDQAATQGRFLPHKRHLGMCHLDICICNLNFISSALQARRSLHFKRFTNISALASDSCMRKNV